MILQHYRRPLALSSVSHSITSVISNNPLSAVIQFAVITAAHKKKGGGASERRRTSGKVKRQLVTRFHFDSAGFIPGRLSSINTVQLYVQWPN